MNHSKLITKLMGFHSRNSQNNCYINRDIYRLLYDRDIYYIAYNNIKSNDGAETSGSDGTSLHGFCEQWIDDIISSLRNESYQPKPSRITYIPKKNGKMRKLSFPNGKDKLVQEAVRIILEIIYEPSFSNLSHGFRPNRSVHSALAQISTWNGTTWFIEGDISACFDEIDHRILENILRERIDDERFIRLINKLLRAGYFDMQKIHHKTMTGTAQGSTCSPILANIFLDKLDRFIREIIERDTMGKYRKQNPQYAKVLYQLKKAKANKDYSQVKILSKKLKSMKSVDVMDSNFRRIHYVRYADDFLIGTTSNKSYAQHLKEEIYVFLRDQLHLRLNLEKTKISNAHSNSIHFLGYIFTKPSTMIYINMDTDKMISRLKDNGMCNADGYPIGITSKLQLPPEDIVKYGNQVLRGLLNSNHGCNNYYDGWRIQYIIQFSIAKTLARKYNQSIRKIFKKYGNNLTINYLNNKGKPKSVSLALNQSFKRNDKFFPKWLNKIKKSATYKINSDNPLKMGCYICRNPQEAHMYHRKKKSRLKQPYNNITIEMLRINRRQVCLCPDCFDKVEKNLLELNQIAKLRKS